MKFSLVLASVGRTGELERFLDSLHCQSYRDFELIIVDQNEDDRVTEIIARSEDVMQIRQLRSGPGLSRARNVGLRHCTGDIVCFPDDDCWYHEKLLQQVASWFELNDRYTVLSGSYTEPGIDNRNFSPEASNLSVPGLFRRLQTVSSITIFLRSQVFTAGKYFFDERLGVGAELPAGEEIDLILRILEDGYMGRYCPQIVIFHEITRWSNTDPAAKMAREEATGYVLAVHALKPNFNLIYRTIARLIKPTLLSLFHSELLQVARYRIKGYRKAVRFFLSKSSGSRP